MTDHVDAVSKPLTKLPIETTPLLGLNVNVEHTSDNESADSTGTGTATATATTTATYGSIAASSTLFNGLVGVGSFSLPYAFKTAGLGLGLCILLIGAACSIITNIYTLDFLARAPETTALADKEKRERLEDHGTPRNADFSHPTSSTLITSTEVVHEISSVQVYSFSDLAGLFAGPIIKLLSQASIIAYGTPLAMATVFSSSAASLYFSTMQSGDCDVFSASPSVECIGSYYSILTLFTFLMVCMVYKELTALADLQQILTVYRGLTFFIMLLTVGRKLYIDGMYALDSRLHTTGYFHFDQFAAAFGPIFNALTTQYQVPPAIYPLKNKAKSMNVVTGYVSVATVIYVLVGVMCALAFDKVNPLVILEWSSYTGCGNGFEPCASNTFPSLLASSIKLLILGFPLFNVISCFPLTCFCVGENLLSCMPEATVARFGREATFLACRMIICTISITVAACMVRIDTLQTIVGLTGSVIGLSLPIFIEMCSIYMWPNQHKTPYTFQFITSNAFLKAFLVISMICTSAALATFKV
ncbi:hypothetical protein SARC_05011 [Sphaeroforma arctica JP610]|uniref:Amino acid transporter transmembrane domain-containing protein n=1 Tax=Sphaeroforma arctica JP610 TaxID=667725 RepID=A0A0L0G0W6_9EUKA|nr:hypothetical protein SARC_05011 [Sphaeroforma arctica JP610]KNC82710.1 hypothetical protein SARC_05011 [Sphaeroforma arctica JP610]|eukprot:XP_014156612.1 hypothetical protein SARC_05011 [Sphaeroforma arctica JP610]